MRHAVKAGLSQINKQSPRELSAREARWIAVQLSSWFSANARSFPWRSADSSPYAILIAELFLQQTPAVRVAKVLPVFLQRFPDFESLRSTKPKEIRSMLAPLGLQRRRTKVLKSLARELAGRDLRQIGEDDWRKLPGVGQYMAAAMLSTLHDKPEPMLDVNAARVFGRYAGPRKVADIRRDRWLYWSVQRVLTHGSSPRILNWALMDLGALVCTSRNPSCPVCPLRARCQQEAPVIRQQARSARQISGKSVLREKETLRDSSSQGDGIP